MSNNRRVFRVLIFMVLVFCLFCVFMDASLWTSVVPDYCTRDDQYNIPEPDRKPSYNMSTFYQQRNQILMTQLQNTFKHFPGQTHTGSVMRDGFHGDLPNNARWKGGKIEMNPEVARLIEAEKKKQQEQQQQQQNHQNQNNRQV